MDGTSQRFLRGKRHFAHGQRFGDRRDRGACDGKVSWTTHADLAEAAAIILADGRFDGPTPALTGSQALDLSDLANLV